MQKDAVTVLQSTTDRTSRVDIETDSQTFTRCFRTMLPSDPRIVLSHIRLRLAELEAGANCHEDAHCDAYRALARETLERYAPMVGRMGMQLLRQRLEDASFRILDPLICEELVKTVAPIRAEDEMCLVVLRTGIQRILEENGIAAIVQGRIKGLYSLYRKLYRLNCPLGSIMDRIGLRVIVSSIAECYQVLDLLQMRFRLVLGTFDDYITHPKTNGYRSLHACFYPVPTLVYKPVEFQIRTLQMHQEAEFGTAAHWRYKKEEKVRLDGEARLTWLRGLLQEGEQAVDHAAFIRQLYYQVFGDRLAGDKQAGLLCLQEAALAVS